MCDQGVPFFQWKIVVCGAQATDEVVFECADGSFCGVTTVTAGGSKLYGKFLFLQKVQKFLGNFVVQHVECWFQATRCEFLKHRLGRCDLTILSSCFHRFSKNVVAVVVIADKDVVVAFCGGDDEFAGEIGVDFAGGLTDAKIEGVCPSGDGDGVIIDL